jgi:hypothetical protein
MNGCSEFNRTDNNKPKLMFMADTTAPTSQPTITARGVTMAMASFSDTLVNPISIPCGSSSFASVLTASVPAESLLTRVISKERMARRATYGSVSDAGGFSGPSVKRVSAWPPPNSRVRSDMGNGRRQTDLQRVNDVADVAVDDVMSMFK